MRPGATSEPRRELTLRGLVLGAAITVVFTGANVFMGLRTGMTFSSSIPAAVISMGALRALGSGGILENNMVQTQASAAGTLCNVILVLPALVLVGRWSGFPFAETAAICLLGGLLGVMYSIPLRRALVVGSTLPFPEGVAAAEVLRAGDAAGGGDASGLRTLAAAGLASALLALCTNGLRLLGDGLDLFVGAGGAVFRIGTGFSLALVGVGYLVGLGACLALLLGVATAWGVAVPLLSSGVLAAARTGGDAAVATRVWADQVRLIGAGIIAIGGVWTVGTLLRPMAASLRAAWASAGAHRRGGALPRQERDIPITLVAVAALLLSAALGVALATFTAGGRDPPGIGFLVVTTALAAVFAFLMATACGYMAGLLGSSSSPISGIGILGIMVVSLLLDRVTGPGGDRTGVMGVALFVTSAVVVVASIANDNLQDLKTGQLVDATPWRQQVALLVGVAAGAIVIPPLLQLLFEAYGFIGHMPHAGMDSARAMAAPQASLVAQIVAGIFAHRLPWRMVAIGLAMGAVLIAIEERLRRRHGFSLPALTVGIGIYLPPSVVVTIGFGGVLGFLAERRIAARAPHAAEALRRRGVLLASGFLVGESVTGMALAALEAANGRADTLAVAVPGFAAAPRVLGAAVFVLSLALFFRAVSRGRPLTLRADAG